MTERACGQVLLVLGFCLAMALPASANDWDALDQPGAVAIMRHALAPGTGDPADFELDDCSTQRILSDAGRDQARRIGAAFRERGITFDRVLTSQWCRTTETAELPISDRWKAHQSSIPSFAIVRQQMLRRAI